MKIAQVLTRYYPAIGGVEDYVKRISEGIAGSGQEVNVFTFNNLDFSHKKRTAKNYELINNVKVRRYSVMPVNFKGYYVSPRLLAGLFKERIDLVHGHSFMFFSADASLLLARIKRLPFVFNPYFVISGNPSFLGSLYRKVIGALMTKADRVIAISDFEKNLIIRLGFGGSNIEVIPPGIDTQEFDNAAGGDIFGEYRLNGKKKILFVGRLSKTKNIEVLINAMPLVLRDYPEAALILAGPDFGARDSLEKLARDKSVEKSVFFMGELERDKLIRVYKNSDIFIFPGISEAFGIVMIEAMAANLPVIAADACAAQEIISEGESGYLFKPHDERGLSQKIIKLLKNKRLAMEFGTNARKYVSENYHISKAVRKISDIYLSLNN